MQQRDDEFFDEFKDANVRRRFIRRVFFILSIQLTFTSVVVAAMQHEKAAVIDWIQTNPGIVILILIAEFIVLIYFMCSNTPRGTSLCAWICLILLTGFLSFSTGLVALRFENQSVLLAASITAIVSLVIFFVAACTKFDLTKYTGCLMIFSLLMCIAVIVCAVVMIFKRDRILEAAFGIIGSLIFSMWLFWDIQVIMGGRSIEISPDEVVYATFRLYFDIVLMFRYVLYILEAMNQ